MKEAGSSPLKRIRNDKSMKDCNRSQGEGRSIHLGLLPMSYPSLSAHRRIMLAGEGARPTRGSPALRNGQYCYFHHRWRATHVDLSQSAHHVTSMFDLPVLEDADSIQVALGQIMRMIVCRQVDTKTAGLLLACRSHPPHCQPAASPDCALSLKDSAILVASHYNQRQSRPPCLKTLHSRP